MSFIDVIYFELTVDSQPIDTIHNMMFVKVRVEYQGGPTGIFAGDKIAINIHNSANEIFNIIGYGNNSINIYGDGDIGKVGTRTYRNDPSGDYILEVEFDDGYYNHFGGFMPDNITGWLEASVFITYKKWVKEPTQTAMTVIINGVWNDKNVNIEIGGGPGPERLDTPGPIIGKSGRYGAYSGNMGDFPEVEFNDYINFDLMRWSLQAGYQNLTWRDLRGSDGESYYTTNESLVYSNNNPTGERYQSNNEPYLMPYAIWQGYPIDAPFHYNNCVLEDYLVIGPFGNVISSSHDYLKDSLRIIRVMGREENTPWWGKDAFRILADSNFLKYDPNEPMDRYLVDLFFKGYRGLTIDEFFIQMQSEGQFLDKSSSDDILSFCYVNNGGAPGVPDPTDTNQIPYFKLMLADLHFDESQSQTIDLVGFDNSVVFSNVPAKNLPYGYLVYYDTKATEAILNNEGFHYNNSASFTFGDDVRTVNSNDMWIKLEDGSGGSGHTTEIRIRKVDENGEPIQGVKFALAHTNISPPHIREAITTINGTASFTLRAGEYTLTEDVSDEYSPIFPMSFAVTNMDELFNLKLALEGTGYPDWDKLEYLNGVNIIINHSIDPPDPPDPPDTDPDICNAIWQIISSIAMEELALSHILNAEGEKLQYILGTLEGSAPPEPATIEQVLKANDSVRRMIETVNKQQMVLKVKMSKALAAAKKHKCL